MSVLVVNFLLSGDAHQTDRQTAHAYIFYNCSPLPITGQIYVQNGRLGIRRDAVGNSDVCQGAAVRPSERHGRHREPAPPLPGDGKTSISAPTPQLPAPSLRHYAPMLVQRRYPKTHVCRNSRLLGHSGLDKPE